MDWNQIVMLFVHIFLEMLIVRICFILWFYIVCWSIFYVFGFAFFDLKLFNKRCSCISQAHNKLLQQKQDDVRNGTRGTFLRNLEKSW